MMQEYLSTGVCTYGVGTVARQSEVRCRRSQYDLISEVSIPHVDFFKSPSEKRRHQLQVILAGTLTGVQGDIRCKVLAVFSTVKYLLVT